MDRRLKELVAALVAGTRYVPLGDNGRVYAELEDELERIRGGSPRDPGATAGAPRARALDEKRAA